ncbi:hypothetical protein [Streptomyces botrytidirepellens]|nr:hypothetical protein [Streptomyces botrytidirepellens]
MALLNSGAEIISGMPSEPDDRGDVVRTAQVVTHPDPRPVSPENGMSVTVQVVVETERGAFPHLPGAEAAQAVEESVAETLRALPQVRQVSCRVVSVWGLPAPQE